jgi:hypothetical protein
MLGRNLSMETTIPEPPIDMQGHGSWCTNCALGNPFDTRFGRVEGVATGADILHIKALSTAGFGTSFSVIKAMEIAYNRGAKVVSMSLGGELQGSIFDDPEVKVVEGLSKLGMIFVIAAANSGPDEYTIGSPGAAPSAITVASYSITDAPKVAYWSSRGPQGAWYKDKPDELAKAEQVFGEDAYKPDCSAPGGGRAEKNAKPDEVLYAGVNGWFDGFYDMLADGFEAMHGCIKADSAITTDDGFKTVDELQKGDYVLAYAGSPSYGRVLDVINRGVQPIMEMKLRNRTIYATYDHPFLALIHYGRGDFRLEWKTMKQLKELLDKGLKLGVVSVNRVPARNGYSIGVNLARWLGFFVGDGWVDDYTIYLALSPDEETNLRYIELTKKLFNANIGIRNDCSQMRASTKNGVEFIEKLGLRVPAKDKFIPKLVFKLPAEEKAAFIQGLMYADGYLNTLGRWIFETTSKRLAQGLIQLCYELGWFVSSTYSRERLVKAPGSKEPKLCRTYAVTITPKPFNYFSRAVIHKSSLHLIRGINVEYFGLQQIKSIKPAGEEQVYDVSVDQYHNFVANGIVCHNTSQATPHVAGLVALLVEAGVVKTAADIKEVLRLKGHPKTVEDGYGLIRLSMFIGE